MFDPSLETKELLFRWLEYRIPGTLNLSKALTRNSLERAVIKDMLTKGISPGLGMFLDFDVNVPTLAFLQEWLAWYGIYPSPDGDLHARPERWWRTQTMLRKKETLDNQKGIRFIKEKDASAFDSNIKKLVVAVSVGRRQTEKLLESFELADDLAINDLSPGNFTFLLKKLAVVRFPPDTEAALLVTSESPELRQKGKSARRVGRLMNALVTKTGTVMATTRLLIKMPFKKAITVQRTLSEDPLSSSPSNVQFYKRHALNLGIATAVTSAKLFRIRGVPKITQKILKHVEFPEGWQAHSDIFAVLVNLAIAGFDQSSWEAGLALSQLLLHLSASKITDGNQDADTKRKIHGWKKFANWRFLPKLVNNLERLNRQTQQNPKTT